MRGGTLKIAWAIFVGSAQFLILWDVRMVLLFAAALTIIRQIPITLCPQDHRTWIDKSPLVGAVSDSTGGRNFSSPLIHVDAHFR